MPGEELGGLSLHVDTLVGDGIVDPFDDSFQRLEAGGSLGLNSGEIGTFDGFLPVSTAVHVASTCPDSSFPVTSPEHTSSDCGAATMEIMAHPSFEKLVLAIFGGRMIGEDELGVRAILSQREEALRSISESRWRRQMPNLPFLPNIALDSQLDQLCNEVEDFTRELSLQSVEANKACDAFTQQLVNICGSNDNGAGFKPRVARCGNITKETRKSLKRCYGEAIRTLNEDFTSRKKKGKLPNDATSKLKQWWSENLVWPYPSEEVKQRIGEETGLTTTQINNWFINQRKRHWHRFFYSGNQPQNPREAQVALREAGVIE